MHDFLAAFRRSPPGGWPRRYPHGDPIPVRVTDSTVMALPPLKAAYFVAIAGAEVIGEIDPLQTERFDAAVAHYLAHRAHAEES